MNPFHIHEITPAEVALRNIVLSHDSVVGANQTLRDLTGIAAFLAEGQAEKVRNFRALSDAATAPRTLREWGDFQTPPALAAQVCEFLLSQNIAPHTVVEPTYGLGNFLSAALDHFPAARQFYGVEIQACYEWRFKMTLLEKALAGALQVRPIALHHDSIFTHQFAPDVLSSENVLILGNPPWVTSAELGALDAQNLPAKTNSSGLSGLAALTGKSNFDLNESILLRLLEVFGARQGTLALLCKNSVIKNWIERLPRLHLNVHDVQALEIDAPKEFGAAVSASLLFARFGGPSRTFSCAVGALKAPEISARRFGWAGDKFVSNLLSYQRFSALDGVSPLVWRQGLKHDCSAVMELSRRDESLVNGLNEAVQVESAFIFPLFKSSDLRGEIDTKPRRWVIVPQRELGEDTYALSQRAPLLWDYLCAHRGALAARKSSIYRGKPAFSIFGIGPYSFAPFKVAVSGLYKVPRWTLLESIAGQSAMLDDTGYFLGFESRERAQLALFLLQSAPAQGLLESLVFSDAKRPYTKELLMRLDLEAIRTQLGASDFVEFWEKRGVVVTPAQFEMKLSVSVASDQLCLL